MLLSFIFNFQLALPYIPYSLSLSLLLLLWPTHISAPQYYSSDDNNPPIFCWARRDENRKLQRWKLASSSRAFARNRFDSPLFSFLRFHLLVFFIFLFPIWTLYDRLDGDFLLGHEAWVLNVRHARATDRHLGAHHLRGVACPAPNWRVRRLMEILEFWEAKELLLLLSFLFFLYTVLFFASEAFF